MYAMELLAVIGVGIWLLTGQLWVLVVSLGVGGEELLESSFILWALGTDPRTRVPAAVSLSEPAQLAG